MKPAVPVRSVVARAPAKVNLHLAVGARRVRVHGGNMLGTGRGEVLSPALGTGNYHWVLAIAPVGLSTAAVYAQLDEQRPQADTLASADGVLAALRAGDPVALGRVLG